VEAQHQIAAQLSRAGEHISQDSARHPGIGMAEQGAIHADFGEDGLSIETENAENREVQVQRGASDRHARLRHRS
jgi:hypothetical protein